MLCKNNGRNRSPPTTKETFQDILSVSPITRNILKHPEHFILPPCNIIYSTSRMIHLTVVMSHFVIFLPSAAVCTPETMAHTTLMKFTTFQFISHRQNQILLNYLEKKRKFNLKTSVLKEFRNLEIHLYIIL